MTRQMNSLKTTHSLTSMKVLGISWIESSQKYTKKMGNSDRVIAESVLHHEKYRECAYSGCNKVSELSLKDFGSYEELNGRHCTFEHGYTSLLDVLKQNIPPENILFDKCVKTVHWDNEDKDCKVRIECANGESYLADYVIVTVSLGVLKAAPDIFIPKLPQRKLEAIDRLGFGVVDKVFLLFDEAPMGKVGRLCLLWDVIQLIKGRITWLAGVKN